jgi:hypothetical protein
MVVNGTILKWYIKKYQTVISKIQITYISDLHSSERISATGLTNILSDIVKLCFSGEPSVPPPTTVSLLEKLVSVEHALCFLTVKGK